MLAVAACIPLALVLLVLGSNMSVRAVRVVAHACDPTQSDSIGQRFAPSDGRRMHTPSIEESARRHLLGVYLVKEIAVLAALALLPQPMLKGARIWVWVLGVIWLFQIGDARTEKGREHTLHTIARSLDTRGVVLLVSTTSYTERGYRSIQAARAS